MLRNGINAITEIPSDRIDIETYYDPRPATPGKMMTRWGGFLENVDQFDADFFGISPREADRLDPQQRLLLEVAWNALEDAGQVPDQLPKSQTGVFIGLWLNDYEARMFADPSAADFYMTTGSGRYSASGRISYFLGLQGPSITIDTACSSSLVAVNLACQSLWSNQCSLAMAGGANVILQPHISIAYSQSKMMAPDGRCKFGDAQADGYVRSEGAGLVILKRLSQAITDGDPIYAVIKGGSINNDGSGSGFLATPSQDGQARMLRTAYQDAGIDPSQVQYVEAHGTGTKAGDPIELGAIGEVLGQNRSAQSALMVGSVKTNFGHTEGAAGVAGLIKVALSLKHGAIPPSLHLNEYNPNIPWQELNLTIPRVLTKFAVDKEIIAGVSAFGITGTNAHAILAEAPKTDSPRSSEHSNLPYLLPLSAHTPEALSALAESYQVFLDGKNPLSLQDVCYTESRHRAHHSERWSIVGSSREEVLEQLSVHTKQKSQGNSFANKVDEQAKVVFVFPGQGSQWLGMGRDLLEHNDTFCGVIAECEKSIRHWADWSLLEQLKSSEDSSAYRLNEISVIQPVLFAIEVGLAAVWQSWGIKPAAVIGHSMGEVAAAYVAGALGLDDVVRVICKRSQLMQRTSGQGEMAVIGLSFVDAERTLVGFEGKLSVAVHNSPRSTVISGDPDALKAVMEKLEAREVFCRKVNVDVASHSPQMDPLRSELVKSLDGIQPQTADIPFYSTATEEICDGKTLDAEYWGKNLRQPVRFSTMIQKLLDDNHTIFIEMSPHPLLLSPIQETGHDAGKSVYGIPSLRRNTADSEEILRSLGTLYESGYSIDWEKLYPTGRLVKLPSYPWQRQRYWYDSASTNVIRFDFMANVEHPLLGSRLPNLAHVPTHYVWQNKFARLRKSLPKDTRVIPESMYREMALAAVNIVKGNNNHTIREFNVHEDLSVSTNPDRILQVSLVENDARMIFQLFSQEADETAWKKHATAEIEAGQVETDWFYDLAWEVQDLQVSHDTSAPTHGTWLILADHLGVGDGLASRLSGQGATCQLVYRNNETLDFDDLLKNIALPLHIVHLWALDLPSNERITPDSLMTGQASGSEALVALVRSIVCNQYPVVPKIWSVTSGAQSVLSKEEPQLSQSTLWGLAKVVSLEQPNLWQGIIDLPTREEVGTLVDFLLAETSQSNGDDQVAYRNGHRYVPRLLPARQTETTANPFNVSADGAYLITGGFGSLGLQICEWLGERGARHIVVTSRDAPPDRASWGSIAPNSKWGKRLATIRMLETKKIQITMAQADAADESAMEKLFGQFGQALPALRGAIHAAGVTSNQTIANFDEVIWRDVLKPKVKGAWILHKLTSGLSLDFFVCFSSAASVWGSQGMAHYAAANHFLDQLALYRCAYGLPALTVNWGWWSGDGIATSEQEDLFARVGLSQMPAEKALSALAYLIETEATQKVVAPVDWAVFKPLFESTRARGLLSRIGISEAGEQTRSVARGESNSILQQLKHLSTEEQKEVLLDRVRQLVAEILGFGTPQSVNMRQGFFKMGMDSLMTVQLRTRLEANFECVLPPTIAFEYPTVTELVNYLMKELLPSSDGTTTGKRSNEEKSIQDGQLNSLSENDLLSLLDNELAKVDNLTKNGKPYE